MTDPEALTEAMNRIKGLERALAEYAQRYGFSDQARALFCQGGISRDKKADPHRSQSA